MSDVSKTFITYCGCYASHRLRGEATITIGDETYHVKTSDVVFIPEGAIHSYQNTGEEPFEFLCIILNKEDKITIVDESC